MEELWEQDRRVCENQENQVDYQELRRQKHDEVRALQNMIQEAWNQQEEANNIDFGQREQRRAEAEAEHEAKLESIKQARTANFAQAEASDVGAGASDQLNSLQSTYENNRADYQRLLDEVNATISSLSGNGGSGGGGGSDTSALTANLSSAQSDLETAQQKLAETPRMITSEPTTNPERESAAAARDSAAANRDTANAALQAANETLNSTPAEEPAGTANPALAEAQAAVDTAQAAATEAQAAVEAAEAALSAIPETIDGTEGPNPAYNDLAAQIGNYEQNVAEYQRQLQQAQEEAASSGAAPESNPELTDAYTKKVEYEAILKDLENTYVADRDVLNAKVQAGAESGGQPVDINNSEEQFQQQIRDAENELREKLNSIDSDSYGDNSKPAEVVQLETNVINLENEQRQIEKDEQAFHKQREDQQREIRAQIRAIEDQMDPLEDRQRAINLEQRPLRCLLYTSDAADE